MPTKIIVAAVIVFGLFAAGGYAVMRSQVSAPEAAKADIGSALPQPAARQDTAPPSDMVSTEGVREVVIVGDNFSFSAKTLTLKKGQKVKLTFVNSEGMHDFKLDAFGVATKKLKAGESETVEFTPDQTGTFEAYCSIGAHRSMGMVTAVTVE